MRQRVTGSVMRRKRLSPEQLLSVQVPVCSLTRQAEVANAVASLRSAAERMNHEVTALSSLRSVIIDGVAAGAIDIPGSYDSLIAEVA
jgi:type I restriction enzyme S subunit